MSSLGTSLAYNDPQPYSSIAQLQASAPVQNAGTVWILTLSPPDPNAGVWAGTFGPGGTIIWPTPLDPSPPAGGVAILPDTEFSDGALV